MDTHGATARVVRFLRGRYSFLAMSLLFLAAAYPVLEAGLLGLGLWTIAFWCVLLGALHAVGMSPHVRRIARILAVLAVSAGVAGLGCYALLEASHEWIFAVFDGLTLLFLALATGVILVDVLFRESVDADPLMGAACVYVLLGLTFAYVLPVLDSFTAAPILASMGPGGLDAGTDPGLIRAEYLYFSFVTLSTLGYGDVVPITLPGRLIASAEAIVGQLFLAILVARLIGLHILSGTTRRE